MNFSWIEEINKWQIPVLPLAAGLLIGFLLLWTVRRSVAIAIKKTHSQNLAFLRKHASAPLTLFFPTLMIFIFLNHVPEEPTTWISIFKILLIVWSSYLLISMVGAIESIFVNKFDLSKEDNRSERKIITQIVFIKKSVIVAIVLVTAGVLLLSFEEGRKYGAGLLTSAGVASIIIGFAAQKSIANFLAGIQIAFTQPIKIDDAVVVEGEWGWIEEINLTYIVVRIWDWRRLVLPITYFIEHPFQNWTRNKGEIIGSVVLHLDYRANIGNLRKKLTELLENDPLWDGQVNALQVIDTKEHTMTVRALMSAKNSPAAWDLRCNVREQLITHLQETNETGLPIFRVKMEN